MKFLLTKIFLNAIKKKIKQYNQENKFFHFKVKSKFTKTKNVDDFPTTFNSWLNSNC
jgi:hypothetical protein